MPSQIEAWISTNSLHGIAWKFNSEKNLAPLQDLKATDIYTEVLLQRVVNYLRWEDGVLVRSYLSSYWLPSTWTRQCAIEKRSVCFVAYLSNMLAAHGHWAVRFLQRATFAVTGNICYWGHHRGSVTFSTIAERVAVELSQSVTKGSSQQGFEHQT